MPRRYDYITVDVFTDRPFAGNPVAVVLDARDLVAEQMQAVAAEFNYSESTFVFPPDHRAHTARVRIFTPRYEVPFAGHPNVGTAFALALVGDRAGKALGPVLAFEESAGLVPVDVSRDAEGRVQGATLTAPQGLTIGPTVPAALVAECVGLEPKAIITSRHEPVFASVGLPFVIAEIASDAVARCKPDIAAFTRASSQFPADTHRFSVFLYARANAKGGEADLRARMFAPLGGVFEDPATGSANGALVALLASLEPKPDTVLKLSVLQGVEIGHPSLLNISAEKQAGAIVRVRVGGRCVPMMEGSFTI